MDTRRIVGVLAFGVLACSLLAIGASNGTRAAPFPTLDGTRPVVIGHRGAAGYLPDHTLEGYRTAIAMGADFIEPDLVSTKDGVLIARHGPELTDSTDVRSIPKFAARRRQATIDGIVYEGWFASDFTLAEIRELRTVQPRPPRSTRFDGAFEIPTFQEIVDLAKKESARLGRTIGIYPETKHSSWHREHGLPLEETLVAMLNLAGHTTRSSPVIIQSFETGNLRMLREMTQVRLVQLLSACGNDIDTGKPVYVSLNPNCAPWDWIARGDSRHFGDMLTVAGLAKIAAYADGIGPSKRQILGVKGIDTNGDGKAVDINGDGAINEADGVTNVFSSLIADAHAAGLFVHAYTFHDDVPFARDYANDPAMEYRHLYSLGVDGVFSDFSDTAFNAREAMANGVWPVIEYNLPSANRYFRTTSQAELAVVAGNRVGGWQLTGDIFSAWITQADNTAAVPVCRVFASNGARHFYSLVASECAAFKAQPGAVDEGVAFHAVAPSASGACPVGTRAVERLRVVNDGLTFERLTASAGEASMLVVKGWSRAGTGLCVPP